jgi:hypothetical protein
MELLGHVGEMEACFGAFGEVLNSTLDTCVVYAE